MTKQNEKDAKRVPELRFKGFTDDWEQRKPKNYLRESRILGSTGVDAKKLTVKLWGKGVVEKKESISGSSNTRYYIRHSGQLMYGKLDFLHAAFGIVPKELDKYESTADSPAFDIIDGNPKFLLESFLRKEFYLRNGQRANGSRKAKRIHEKDFLEMPILVPYKSEQTKIGNLINSLDKTITLHEEQHRQLEQLKKALLQKMFADETGYPALRFKGFTEKWEQRKLGETVVNIVAGGDINKAELLSKGKYPVYANALTNNGIVGYYASQYRIAAPAVTVTGRGDIGIAKARDINFTPVVRLLAISSQHNNYFLENLINTHRSFAESTGVPQLTVPQLSNYKLYFPQKINEEVFIGKLFKKMDHLTTLHQHKIDNLKRLKRALLQKMFV
ncbi:restriction endonuclease subunit S [Limosilactobacillus mucosae]|uniref:restriction endonuclease subunit S n=1 Tax=Limosilactobacillus mucosae TaxID=97478 RepID=UPI003994A819